MPAPVTVTDDEILLAGRAVAAEGRPVTGWSLRSAIGRGDPARLDLVWQRAREAQPADDAVPVLVPLPPVVEAGITAVQAAVAERIASMGSVLWQSAERLAMERVQGEADAARADAAELRRQLDEAHAILAAADERADTAEARVDAAEAAAAQAERDARAEVGLARADLRLALDAMHKMQAVSLPQPPADFIRGDAVRGG